MMVGRGRKKSVKVNRKNKKMWILTGVLAIVLVIAFSVVVVEVARDIKQEKIAAAEEKERLEQKQKEEEEAKAAQEQKEKEEAEKAAQEQKEKEELQNPVSCGIDRRPSGTCLGDGYDEWN